MSGQEQSPKYPYVMCVDCENREYCQGHPEGPGPMCIKMDRREEAVRDYTITQVMRQVKEAIDGFPNETNSGIKSDVTKWIKEKNEGK